MNHSLCSPGTSGGGRVTNKGNYNYNARQKAFKAAARDTNSSQCFSAKTAMRVPWEPGPESGLFGLIRSPATGDVGSSS